MQTVRRLLLFSLLTVPLAGYAADALPDNLHIRSLAASCAACHGTYGNTAHPAGLAPKGKATLAGMEKDHFIQQLNAFKNGERTSTVMHHHAKGLNAEEIQQLAAFFAAQNPKPPQTLKHQTLEANHE